MEITREYLTEFINSILIKYLEQNEFCRIEEDELIYYKKKYSWGFDEFSFSRIAFLTTHLEFGINIYRRYDFIEKIWQEFAPLLDVKNSNIELLPTIIINHVNAHESIQQKNYFDGSLRFEISDGGLEEIPNAIAFVFNQIFKKCDLFLDIKELDNIINHDLDPPSNIDELFFINGGFMFKRMALAKYTNNPIYEQICDLYKSRFEKIEEIAKAPGKDFFLNYPLVFNKVYKKLKHLEPYRNTLLSNETI